MWEKQCAIAENLEDCNSPDILLAWKSVDQARIYPPPTPREGASVLGGTGMLPKFFMIIAMSAFY